MLLSAMRASDILRRGWGCNMVGAGPRYMPYMPPLRDPFHSSSGHGVPEDSCRVP